MEFTMSKRYKLLLMCLFTTWLQAINASCYSGNELHRAVDSCNISIIRNLLSNDLRLLNEINAYSKTPLYRAVELFHVNEHDVRIRSNYLQIITILLQAGADVSILPPRRVGYLLFAVKEGFSDLLQVFLEKAPLRQEELQAALDQAERTHQKGASTMLAMHMMRRRERNQEHFSDLLRVIRSGNEIVDSVLSPLDL